jgi:hypothetical protein
MSAMAPRNGFAVLGARRGHSMGEQHAAHRRRRAGDEKPNTLAHCLGRNAAHRIGRCGIEKRHRCKIDHERLAGVGDAVEHRPHRCSVRSTSSAAKYPLD